MSVTITHRVRYETPGTSPAERTLLWSEYLFVVAVAISEFVLTIDPLEWNVNRITALKHLPLAITIVAVALTTMGRRLRHAPADRRGRHSILAAGWPLAVLGAFIAAGSLYARFILGDISTFLNLGVYMEVVLLAALMLVVSTNPHAMIRWYMGILVAGALIMGLYIVYNYGKREVYHEQIFMVIPIAIWFVTAVRNRAVAWAGALGMLSLGFFSAKNTSYLVLIMTSGYIALQQGLPRIRRMAPAARLFTCYLVLMTAVVVMGVLAYIWMHKEQYLPSGNVQYRSHTYERAWHEYLDSPIWGTAFTDASVKKFSLYSIDIAGGVLPTHSDVMDLLSNGGTVAAALWLCGMFLVARRTYRWLIPDGDFTRRWGPYAHTLVGVSAAGIITYSFNPVLLEPGMAYMAWAALGLLIGMSVLAERQGGEPDRASLRNRQAG